LSTEIYLIRHGETVANREGIFRGRLDFPLNENGLIQAEALAEELKRVEFAAIFSSPLTRAVQTAEAIARRHNLTPIIDDGFQNINLGIWQGKDKGEVKRDFPELWRLWDEEPENLLVPGGERLADVRRRAKRSLDRIVEDYKGKKIAVVSHRSVLKCLLAEILNMKENYFWKFHFDTASYSILEHSRDYTIYLFNETKHLKNFIREER